MAADEEGPSLKAYFSMSPLVEKLPGNLASSKFARQLTTNTTKVVEFRSTGPGNKAWHAGPHHSVEPDVRRYAVPNLPHGVFRQGRNLKVRLDIVRFGRGGQESRAALYGPGERNLCRRLVDALCDGCDHGVVEHFG